MTAPTELHFLDLRHAVTMQATDSVAFVDRHSARIVIVDCLLLDAVCGRLSADMQQTAASRWASQADVELARAIAQERNHAGVDSRRGTAHSAIPGAEECTPSSVPAGPEASRYVELPNLGDLDTYQVLERFVAEGAPASLAEDDRSSLRQTLLGRCVLARFETAVAALGLSESWQSYYDEQVKELIRAFCSTHDICAG